MSRGLISAGFDNQEEFRGPALLPGLVSAPSTLKD
jgi:hypothetical protein